MSHVIAEGQRIHHNFVKPRQALGNDTRSLSWNISKEGDLESASNGNFFQELADLIINLSFSRWL